MRYIYIILALLVLLPLVSATTLDLGKFGQTRNLNLIMGCKFDNGTYCPPSPNTLCNITTLNYPSPLQIPMLVNSPMTQSIYPIWNITVPDTSIQGTYQGTQHCCQGGVCGDQDFTFDITGQGNNAPTTSQSILYALMFIFSVLFFLGTLILGIYLPYDNRKDEFTGYILAVDNVKYIKLISLAVSYLMMMLMFYLGWQISNVYLDLDFLSNLLQYAFYFTAVALLPLFMIGVYLVIANAVRDHKIGDQLQRGFSVRE